jgi:hypothetical protein
MAAPGGEVEAFGRAERKKKTEERFRRSALRGIASVGMTDWEEG